MATDMLSSGITKFGACVILAHPTTKELVTVSRKPDSKERCFPGGKVEEGELFSLAAVRELQEEAGICFNPCLLTPVYSGRCTGGWTTAFLGSLPANFDISKYVSPEGLSLKMMTGLEFLKVSAFPEFDKKALRAVEKLLT